MTRGSLRLFSAVVLILALPVLASAGEALSLVPLDATTVAMMHVTDLRTSPITGKLFAEADKASVDGEAARFLAETGLKPTEDVDTMVVAMSPDVDGKGTRVLVAVEGRFDPVKLTASLTSRGAQVKTTAAGSYLVIPEDSPDTDGPAGPGAVAFVSRTLAIAGSESSVSEALVARKNGGSEFLARAALGREKYRVPAAATSWMLVDVPRSSRYGSAPTWNSGGSNANLANAIKNVSVVAVWATDAKDSIEFGGAAVSYDAETRQLLEDTVKGALAAWRLAAQEKAPELVAEIRKFDVGQKDQAVTLTGSLSAQLISNWTSKIQHEQQKAAK